MRLLAALLYAIVVNALWSVVVGLGIGLLAALVAFIAGFEARPVLLSWWLGSAIVWYLIEMTATVVKVVVAVRVAYHKARIEQALRD